MRKRLAIAAGVVVSSALTHGIVYSGAHLGKLLPAASYDGLFLRAAARAAVVTLLLVASVGKWRIPAGPAQAAENAPA